MTTSTSSTTTTTPTTTSSNTTASTTIYTTTTTPTTSTSTTSTNSTTTSTSTTTTTTDIQTTSIYDEYIYAEFEYGRFMLKNEVCSDIHEPSHFISDMTIDDCLDYCYKNGYGSGNARTLQIAGESDVNFNCNFVYWENNECSLYEFCYEREERVGLPKSVITGEMQRQCNDNFVDSYKENCGHYGDNYCTVTGVYTTGWEDDWGPFENYTIDSFTGWNCPEFGCDYYGEPTTTPPVVTTEIPTDPPFTTTEGTTSTESDTSTTSTDATTTTTNPQRQRLR